HYLAKSSILGSIVGLIFSIPLYYFFEERGIVPAIILTSIVVLLFSWIYTRRIKFINVKTDKSIFIEESMEMLKMGFLISMSSLITLGISYIVRIYINNSGGIVDVGLFSAGFAIVSTYVGMI